jgi:hypothetical protein
MNLTGSTLCRSKPQRSLLIETRPVKRSDEEMALGQFSNVGVQGQNRTDDTRIFSPLLYRLSYLDVPEIGEGLVTQHAVVIKPLFDNSRGVCQAAGLRAVAPVPQCRDPYGASCRIRRPIRLSWMNAWPHSER